MAFTGPLEDRIAIRELYGTYADCAFRADHDGWLACWSGDGTWSTAFGDVTGHAALSAQWHVIKQTFVSMGFFSEVGAIEVDGDAATGRCWCREILNLGERKVRKIIGRYEDELARGSDGQWRFVRRSYAVMLDEPSSP